MTRLGIFSDETGGHTLAKLESELGRTFATSRINACMEFAIPSNRDDGWADRGRRIYHNANAETVEAQPIVAGGWAGIAAGALDHYFHGVAAAALADARFSAASPLDLSLHHEQAVVSSAQCGVGCNGAAEDYKAFFRRAAEIFHAGGATIDEGGPLRLVWCPTITMFNGKNKVTARSVDPALDATGLQIGVPYHRVGLDMYSRLGKNGLAITDPTASLRIVSAYAAARGVPFLIGEYGCADGLSAASHQAKADYWTLTAAALRSFGAGGPGSCETWCLSHIQSSRNWIDSSPASLTAFKAVALDPWFSGV